MNKDKTGKRKISTVTKFFIGLILLFVFSILIFSICVIDQIKTDALKSINEKATNNYCYFNDNKEIIFKKLNIPDTGTYYITGELKGDHYLAYKNELLDHDVIFTMDKNNMTGYWGIKVVDNNVCEAWWSSNKLSGEELIEYDFTEQKHKLKLINGFRDDSIIGYYKARK